MSALSVPAARSPLRFRPLALCLFAALALAMDKHHAQVFGRAPASGWVTGLRLV